MSGSELSSKGLLAEAVCEVKNPVLLLLTGQRKCTMSGERREEEKEEKGEKKREEGEAELKGRRRRRGDYNAMIDKNPGTKYYSVDYTAQRELQDLHTA